MKKILIIEDDIEIATALVEYLKRNGFESKHFSLPLEALSYLEQNSADLTILDIMLPQINGFEFCKEVRKSSDLPIIMLTARGDITDRIVGLEVGADDYLPKPFEPRELLARIEAVLRRSQRSGHSTQQNEYFFEDFKVNFAKRQLLQNGVEVELTTHEFDILQVFVNSKGEVVSRDDIMNNLLGVDADVFSRSIDVGVSRLRQKLGDDPKNSKFIKTIWGKGYQFLPVGEFK